MQCPSCQHKESRVLESRPTEGGQSIRRRRECLECKHRFTTYERIEFVPVTVVKRDKHRQPFDRSKLLRGIARACEKTGTTHLQIEAIVEEIEGQLQQKSGREIDSREIGELVLEALRRENEVAYIRFASVYRQFKGIDDFIETLKDLQLSSDRPEIARNWYVSDSNPVELETLPSVISSSN
ncbi:MAG: transcriptional regulator NrdR [Cyanobacteriota bacterium]|nr:transcriptional regulator NrdR [Cyanobacteriota bacterium]